MEVQVRNAGGELLWARNTVGGYTSASYGNGPTLASIRDMLELALYQCRGELTVSNDINRMCNSSAASTYVDRDVPVA